MKDRWPIVAFTALLATAIGWLIVGDIAASLSADADLLKIAKGDAVYGPREFWLNRYQTLIAGIVAVIAGALTLVAARWQVRAADRQLAEQRFQAAKAANLRVFLELEATTRALIQVIFDINQLGGPYGRNHTELPAPALLDAINTLVPLSFDDTTDLFNLCMDMKAETQEAHDIADIFDVSVDGYIQIAAATYVPRVHGLRNRFAAHLGWPATPVPLESFIAKIAAKHADYVIARDEILKEPTSKKG